MNTLMNECILIPTLCDKMIGIAALIKNKLRSNIWNNLITCFEMPVGGFRGVAQIRTGFEKHPFINSTKHWYQMHLFLSHYLPCPPLCLSAPRDPSTDRLSSLCCLGTRMGSRESTVRTRMLLSFPFFFLQSLTTERVHRVGKSPVQQWQGSK